MKNLLFKLNFSFENGTLVSIEDESRYHFVSIEFHEFEIDRIIAPTMKILCMENK